MAYYFKVRTAYIIDIHLDALFNFPFTLKSNDTPIYSKFLNTYSACTLFLMKGCAIYEFKPISCTKNSKG